jgi:hypothetical protein
LTASRASASPAEFGSLAISLSGDADQLDRLGASDDWPRACQNLGKSLVSGTGPWGFGLFGNFSCKKLAAKVNSDSERAKSEWTLSALLAADKLQFQINRRDIEQPLAKSEVPVSKDLLQRIGNSKLASLIGEDLLEKLPAWAAIKPAQIKESGKKLELQVGTKLKNFPQPPKQISIYTLEFDSGRKRWWAHVIAKGDKTESKSKKTLTWLLDRPVETSGLKVYAHDYRGRGANSDVISRLIEDAVKKPLDDEDSTGMNLADAAAKILDQGFVGVRYGRSVSSGQLARKIYAVSLLTELRGAPLDGLRLYADLWPKVSEEALTGPTSFSGSRVVLGWALGAELGGIVDRIDLVPKIGVWSMKTQFKLPSTDGTIADYDFNFASGLSTGVELGVEKQLISKALLRLWLGADFSSISGAAATKAKINELRVGTDVHVKVLTLGPVNWSLLAFGQYEQIQLSKSYSDNTQESVLRSIRLNLGMIGGGLAISW